MSFTLSFLLGCTFNWDVDGMRIDRRLTFVGIMLIVLSMTMATQYAITRVGYVYKVVHPSDANIRFIGSDYSSNTTKRVLQALNNGTTGTIKVELGEWFGGTNKTFTAAFGIVNEEPFAVNITHCNVSTVTGQDYLEISLHGMRKSKIEDDSGDTVFLWNKGSIVSAATSTAWVLAAGDQDPWTMDGSQPGGISTLWDSTSGVRWSTYNTTAVNETDDYVWVQISLNLPQTPGTGGLNEGAIFIHFEAAAV